MPSTLLLDVVGGLVLFLFGVLQLATGVEALAGDRARAWLTRWTSNRFSGIATGAVATTVLDSSSVTIILVIALVNGGLLSFSQSIGVIMGANIGTTVSSQVFALDVEAYAPLVMAAGFGLFVVARHSARWRSVGLSVLGLAFHLLFNLTTVAVGLLLLEPLGELAGLLPGGHELPRQIANAHVLFNVGGVLLFVGFVPTLASLLQRAIPDAGGDEAERRRELDPSPAPRAR